ncbi:hypothetical protein BJY21_003565 [Kineosphaera limosa]|nr:hypothetical protein [Kineosphaera limosa]
MDMSNRTQELRRPDDQTQTQQTLGLRRGLGHGPRTGANGAR